MPKTMNELFEDSFFESTGMGHHTASAPAITSAAEMEGTVRGQLQLRFTTAKAKMRDLIIEERPDGYVLRSASMRRIGFSDLSKYLQADNQVNLTFSEELMNFEPDEELVHKSKMPLWVCKPMTDGSVAIQRVWKAA